MSLLFFSRFLILTTSRNELNTDLQKISQWTFQWKMHFNYDPKKQVNEVIFSEKSNKL